MKRLLMKQVMQLKSTLLILFILITSACGIVRIKDSEWCGDLGPKGASCFNTLSSKSRDIPKTNWDKDRIGMICTQSENFANWKEAILKLCDQNSECQFEELEKNLSGIEKKLNKVANKIDKKQVAEKPE